MDSENNAKIVVRPAVENDKSFILSTWLKGNYYGNEYFKQMIADLYYKEYSKHIEKILFSDHACIDVACDENNPSWIVGFIVYEGNSIYWAYTKRDYRGKGILSLLCMGRDFTIVTSTTKIGQAITKAKGLIFNPMKE